MHIKGKIKVKELYNIASTAAQSNSVHARVLQISIVHSHCMSKNIQIFHDNNG